MVQLTYRWLQRHKVTALTALVIISLFLWLSKSQARPGRDQPVINTGSTANANPSEQTNASTPLPRQLRRYQREIGGAGFIVGHDLSPEWQSQFIDHPETPAFILTTPANYYPPAIVRVTQYLNLPDDRIPSARKLQAISLAAAQTMANQLGERKTFIGPQLVPVDYTALNQQTLQGYRLQWQTQPGQDRPREALPREALPKEGRRNSQAGIGKQAIQFTLLHDESGQVYSITVITGADQLQAIQAATDRIIKTIETRRLSDDAFSITPSPTNP